MNTLLQSRTTGPKSCFLHCLPPSTIPIGTAQWKSPSSGRITTQSVNNILQKYLFICLAAPGLSCNTWVLVPWSEMESRLPALGARSLSHWTTKEVQSTNLFWATTMLHFRRRQWHPNSSTLGWKIPWMEEPGRLQSMGSLRVGHDWATSLSRFTFMHWRRKWQPTPVFLPGESQGQGSLVGCHLRGRTESDTTEVT